MCERLFAPQEFTEFTYWCLPGGEEFIPYLLPSPIPLPLCPSHTADVFNSWYSPFFRLLLALLRKPSSLRTPFFVYCFSFRLFSPVFCSFSCFSPSSPFARYRFHLSPMERMFTGDECVRDARERWPVSLICVCVCVSSSNVGFARSTRGEDERLFLVVLDFHIFSGLGLPSGAQARSNDSLWVFLSFPLAFLHAVDVDLKVARFLLSLIPGKTKGSINRGTWRRFRCFVGLR